MKQFYTGDRYETVQRLEEAIPDWNIYFSRMATKTLLENNIIPKFSTKFERLLDLLTRLYRENKTNNEYKGIVFVTRVSMLQPVGSLLKQSGFEVSMVSGTGSMSEATRISEIDNFRANETNVLVCTPSIEEGIDIPSASYVIRFEKTDTTRAHIQGSGRARHESAQVFYFDNNSKIEENKREKLEMCAANKELSLTKRQLQNAKEKTKTRKALYNKIHPYFIRNSTSVNNNNNNNNNNINSNEKENLSSNNNNTGELNLFNSTSKVFEYCAKVMKQPITKDMLVTNKTERFDCFPPIEKVIYRECRVPTPGGWLTVTSDHVDKLWGNTDIEDVVDGDCIRKLSNTALELKKLFYSTAIELANFGFLDENGSATIEAVQKTRKVCPRIEIKSQFKFK
eukprot:Pgem_evm1s7380